MSKSTKKSTSTKPASRLNRFIETATRSQNGSISMNIKVAISVFETTDPDTIGKIAESHEFRVSVWESREGEVMLTLHPEVDKATVEAAAKGLLAQFGANKNTAKAKKSAKPKVKELY